MTIRSFGLALLSSMLFLLAFGASFGEKWIYYSGRLTASSQAVQKALAFIKQAKACGVTHMFIGENPTVGSEVSDQMLQHLKLVSSIWLRYRGGYFLEQATQCKGGICSDVLLWA